MTSSEEEYDEEEDIKTETTKKETKGENLACMEEDEEAEKEEEDIKIERMERGNKKREFDLYGRWRRRRRRWAKGMT